jgi:hypothetical protein
MDHKGGVMVKYPVSNKILTFGFLLFWMISPLNVRSQPVTNGEQVPRNRLVTDAELFALLENTFALHDSLDQFNKKADTTAALLN